jgi:predicted dehydrogenase
MTKPEQIQRRKVRLGFIGAGWWSTTVYMPILACRRDVELVSVCGLDEHVLRRCQKDFGFPHATTDYRELLRRDLDGVIVTSPHTLHGEHALATLRAGCHVMVDKPMTTDTASARAIVAEARRRRRHVVVPCGWQYRPIGVKAKKILEQGRIGRVEHVVCHMASALRNLMSGRSFDFGGAYVPANLSTWADPQRAGGGYGQGQLPHSIGLMLWLTGLRGRRVFARMSQPGAAVDLYDAITVEYESGAIGTISGAATLPPDSPGGFQLDIRIFGTRGMLHLDVSRDHLSTHTADGKHRRIALAPGGGAYQCDAPPAQFVDLIAGRTRENNSPGLVAMHAVEIIDAAYRSARTGRFEKIPPERRARR